MKSIRPLDCDNLILLKAGDEHALTFFYSKYGKKVYAMAFYILKDRFHAEDVLQEVFVYFWNSRAKLEEEKDIWLVLYVMCKQKSLNKLRSIFRYEKYKTLHSDHIEKKVTENHFGIKDIKKLVQLAMDKMTPTQQKIFQLSRDEGLTYSEIAQLLSISPNTVKNHMVAALSIVKKLFKGYEFMAISFFFIFI